MQALSNSLERALRQAGGELQLAASVELRKPATTAGMCRGRTQGAKLLFGVTDVVCSLPPKACPPCWEIKCQPDCSGGWKG